MPSPTPGRPEQDLGRTEIARGCMDPTFKHAFRLNYSFEEEQRYVIRVYDEDLRYATDLNEHDYLGGCIFSLGQLMGAKGCSIARPLKKGKSYIILTGNLLRWQVNHPNLVRISLLISVFSDAVRK